MKYVLYSPAKGRYCRGWMRDIGDMCWTHTLVKAVAHDTYDEANEVLEKRGGIDDCLYGYRVETVTEQEIFKAILKGEQDVF